MSSTIFQQLQKQRYRITLDITALGDFNPADIDWDKLFGLDGSEHCEAYVEDLSTPDTWWGLLTEASKVSQ
jgi:hypothetical protein